MDTDRQSNSNLSVVGTSWLEIYVRDQLCSQRVHAVWLASCCIRTEANRETGMQLIVTGTTGLKRVAAAVQGTFEGQAKATSVGTRRVSLI